MRATRLALRRALANGTVSPLAPPRRCDYDAVPSLAALGVPPWEIARATGFRLAAGVVEALLSETVVGRLVATYRRRHAEIVACQQKS